jgi:NADH-quinone oxidoreductase subunit J
MTLQLIVFIVLALFIAVCSVLAVTTSRILRAATYLLFVLFGTAGIYFQLNYSFLGAVQLLIYADGPCQSVLHTHTCQPQYQETEER